MTNQQSKPTIAILQEELETTRLAYHQLVERVPPSLYTQPSSNPAWTIGEELFHITLAPTMLTQDVRMFLKNPWYMRLIVKILNKKTFDRLNAWYTRLKGSRATPENLKQTYDRGHQAALTALLSLKDEDLERTLTYPNWDPQLSGKVTLAHLFHYITRHFKHHAKSIEDALTSPNYPTVSDPKR